MTSTVVRPSAPNGPVPEPGVPPPPAESTRSGLAGLLELPGQAVRSVVRSARATPGLLTVIAVGLVVLTLLTGLIGAITAQQKSSTINDLITNREPLTAASQEVYRSLADADATAAIAFLVTGTEPAELRTRYDQDIARAGSALAKAASDAQGTAADQVNLISQQLPAPLLSAAGLDRWRRAQTELFHGLYRPDRGTSCVSDNAR